MEKEYIIAWKNNSNGRMGRGKTLMEQQEAERLAGELNREHPEFEHVAIHKDTESMVGLFSKIPQVETVLETSLMGSTPAVPANTESEFHFPEEPSIWGAEESDGGEEREAEVV